ncbi:MAG: response regulator [Bacteriovoracaceae bacterium]|nr:response regulator [Bacteroidota bacterium]
MKPSHENIGELLRSVDAVIKSGDLQKASILIDTILELNPRNVYARAYRERIEELEKLSVKKSTSSPAATPPIVPSLDDDRHKDSMARVIPSKYEQKLSAAVLEAYKTLLNEIWRDGDVTPLEVERMYSMREFFDISLEEHEYLEQNVRLTCYLNAVKDAWNKGTRDFSRIKTIFNITDQEEVILRPKVDRLIKSLKAKGVILSLDDDKNFLLLVERLLEKNGYHSLNTTSGEEALNLLENFTPDLVLCDIAFGLKNMNGFMFYELFRSIERFAAIPFIFISALNQIELITTGKKIGVDDYITKPVDNDVLLAAIEGRIRRVREMKKAVDF